MKRQARRAQDEAGFVRLCRRIAESRWFQNSILGVIVFNAAVMGLETSRDLVAAYGAVFAWLNALVQALFVA